MASVPIELGDEAGVIRWAISHDIACVKEPLEGRGLLLTWDPEWSRETSWRGASAAMSSPSSFVGFEHDVAAALNCQLEVATEWRKIALPGATAFVGYSAAKAASPAMDPSLKTVRETCLPELMVYRWRFWIERVLTDWVLHWPGVGSEKLGEIARRIELEWREYSAGVAAKGDQDLQRANRGVAELHITDGAREYQIAFERVRQGIVSGDYYLANLTLHFSARLEAKLQATDRINEAELYLRLRRILPAPQGCYLSLGKTASLFSASPERLVKINGNSNQTKRRIETCPIKGTRPVKRDSAENLAEIAALIASPKENAELSMIVDLERNDLSRVCKPGSVVVEGGFRVESTPHVHHRVATVSGEMRERVSLGEVIAAVFPGGSVTGAPKISAVNALASIERVAREYYCGSVFWFHHDGSVDSNILIRSICLHRRDTGDQVMFGAGGGITIDSDCNAEYMECFQKARGMAEALEPWVDITMIRDALAGRGVPDAGNWQSEMA